MSRRSKAKKPGKTGRSAEKIGCENRQVKRPRKSAKTSDFNKRKAGKSMRIEFKMAVEVEAYHTNNSPIVYEYDAPLDPENVKEAVSWALMTQRISTTVKPQPPKRKDVTLVFEIRALEIMETGR